MSFSAVIKTKVSIGTTKPAAVIGDYTSDTFTAIKGLTDIGEFGDENEEIRFSTIEDGRVHKLKGSADAGNWDVEVARDAADAGQIALRAAAKADGIYNFRVELADGTDFYFRGNVMAAKNAFGSNDVNKQKFTVGITSEILEVEAA
ncbi:phage tail tube protein [Methylobacterium oryzisoli]|uniref:phage tail tube protein n=1 Tax=Methylobacterium oryzisoli TaxID=3385502 RepID=UPI00397BD38D